MSTQSTSYQQEAANRLHLPFALLLDQQLKMTHALRLPTFEVQGWTLIKGLTIVIHQGKIEKVFYPVFPPDKHDWTKFKAEWKSARRVLNAKDSVAVGGHGCDGDGGEFWGANQVFWVV